MKAKKLYYRNIYKLNSEANPSSNINLLSVFFKYRRMDRLLISIKHNELQVGVDYEPGVSNLYTMKRY